MKKWGVLLVFSFCFTLLPSFAQQKINSSIDSVLVSPQVIDANNSSKGNDDAEVYFEIINNSCHEIYIEKIRASCTCVSLSYNDCVIAAGERRKVFVGLANTNASRYHIYTTLFDKSENEGRTVIIRINTNHSDTISSHSNNVILTPSVLEFSNASVDYTSEAIVEIKNNGKKDVFIRHVFEPCTCISVEYDKDLIKPNQTKQIKVKYSRHKNSTEPVEFDLIIFLSNTGKPMMVKIVG